MTKKDFELIARVISVLKNNHHITPVAHEQIALEFAGQLKNINPRFDFQKFLTACDVDGE